MRSARLLLVNLWAFSLALTVLPGCQPRRAWRYTPEPPARTMPATRYSLVVLPFADKRGDDNSDLRLLSLIPLWPYGPIHYDRPEGRVGGGAADPMVFDPQVDLREAIAGEIRSAGLFENVRLGSSPDAKELALSGEIDKTEYRLSVTYYGLSIPAGPLLSLFLPNMRASNELEVRLRLVDPSSGATLWAHTIQDSEGHIYWIYERRREFMFDDLFKDAMPATLTSLSQAVAARSRPGIE
jgi:hypothetical protein